MPTGSAAPVAVSIVTYNSARYIRHCLESLLSLDPAPAEIVIVDNFSRDATPALIQETVQQLPHWFASRVQFVRLDSNTGFCAAHNLAIARTQSPWVLVLNPDVILRPGFLDELTQACQRDARIGTACGKLRLLSADLSETGLLDSTGIYFTPELRHFDRGWGEVDHGQYDRAEYVFGSTGAAALYRREMIEDVSVNGEFFDEAFFAYREDADVAWRAQLLGWRCLYVPTAEAGHVRQVRPGPRTKTPARVNMHSVKNRFLMRVNNLTPGVWHACRWPALWRDLLVIAGCCLREFTSLPAFCHFARLLPRALRNRQAILARRRVSDLELARWFRPETPETFSPTPVTEIPARRS